MLPKIADVVVIGGGIIGTSITHYLTRYGVKVVLLEKEGIGSGTSSAAEGVIFLQLKKLGIHLLLALQSVKQYEELYEELKEEVDIDIEYKNMGTMLIIQNDEEFEAMRKRIRDLKKNGLDVVLLDRKEAREKEPALSENIYGATFSPLDAQVNPMHFCFALVRSSIKNGAKIFTHSEVLEIKTNKGKIEKVVTNNGDVLTNIVVNAAGIFAPKIGEMVNIKIPIIPRRGQVLVTEVVPKILNRPITAARYLGVKYNPEIAKINKGKAAAVEPTENGNLLIGATRELVGFNNKTTFEGIKEVAENAIAMVPKLKEVSIIRTFAGLRPYTTDGLPILGEAPQVRGFFIAAGHEGDGIALAPVTGDLISELIIEGKSRIDLKQFSINRFDM